MMATEMTPEQQKRESTRWSIERWLALSNAVILAILLWFGTTVMGLKDSSVEFHVKQDRVLTDLEEVKEDVGNLERSVIRLELIEEKKLHDKED